VEQPMAGTRPIHPWVAAAAGGPRFGVCMLGRQDWSAFVAWVQEAEALGFDSVWGPGSSAEVSGLGHDAYCTRAPDLDDPPWSAGGCISYRSPVVLAQVAADVDRLSHGRIVVGVGIGDVQQEFRQRGISMGSVPGSNRT